MRLGIEEECLSRKYSLRISLISRIISSLGYAWIFGWILLLTVRTNECVSFIFRHKRRFRLVGDALIFEGSLLSNRLFFTRFMSPLDSLGFIILKAGCFCFLKLNLLSISLLANIFYFISLNSIYRCYPLMIILKKSWRYVGCMDVILYVMLILFKQLYIMLIVYLNIK